MRKDYIIIGGGAAGIAAAYKILGSSKTACVQLLEGTNRYGGRAKTDTRSIQGLAFDKGCVYIQDPKNPLNPWPKIARDLGFTLIEEDSEYKLRINTGSGFETMNTDDVGAINVLRSSVAADFEANKRSPNLTVTADPMAGENEAFALATSEYGPFTESAEPWNYLAADRAREASEDWGENLFVEEGLGNLVKAYGEQLKKRYGTGRFTETFKAVREVKYDADKVTVTDISGNKYTADACIITVPVSVLETGNIRFTPALPRDYTTALQALRLGAYKKLAVQLINMPAGILDDTNYYLYNAEPEGIWQVFRLSFYPRNVLVVHTSGDFAAQLDEMPDDAVFNLFKTTFSNAYNHEPLFAEKFGITQWNKDEFALGAYSYTQPLGKSKDDPTALNARKQMAKPLANKIFFAGEAYNLKAYGTLHGAFIDGEDAAENALRVTED